MRDPADLRLGEVEAQRREAVEHAAEHHLECVAGAPDRVLVELRERIDAGGDLLQVVLVGVASRTGGPAGVEGDVRRERHVQVEGGRPEAVVLGSRDVVATRVLGKGDALEPRAGAVLHLVDGILDARVRQHAHDHQPLGGYRAVLLVHELVPRVIDRQVGVVVVDLEEVGAVEVVEQDLSVDAVHVLLPQALLVAAGAALWAMVLSGWGFFALVGAVTALGLANPNEKDAYGIKLTRSAVTNRVPAGKDKEEKGKEARS